MIATLILVLAGTSKKVVCTQALVAGSWMKYETQSGLLVTVFCGSVCSVTSTWPLLAYGVKFSVGGCASRKWKVMNRSTATTATTATSSVVARAATDTGPHLDSVSLILYRFMHQPAELTVVTPRS